MVTKKVCLDKTFPLSLSHFMLHFIMFYISQMTSIASNDFIFKSLLFFIQYDKLRRNLFDIHLPLKNIFKI